MKIFLKSLQGCGMRRANLQQYEDFFVQNGHLLVSKPEESDVILLWTCAFRGDFRDNSLAEIKNYLQNFKSELIVIGCLPDIDLELLKKNFSGRFINWKNDDEALEKLFGRKGIRLADVQMHYGEVYLTHDIEKFKQKNPSLDVSFFDQFNKLFISEGCQFQCSYCSEILAFPAYKSFPEDDLVSECRQLIHQTQLFDIALMADSICDYGTDCGSSLPLLMRRLCDLDFRIRLVLQGFNPAGFIRFFDEISQFLSEGRIRHMQIPIQSASEKILRLMNRPYKRHSIDKIFTFLNEKKFTEFETHIIVGFPGEKDEDVDETVRFVIKHRPRYVLANRYMESPEMPSAKLLEKVDHDTARERLSEAVKKIQAAGILCNFDDSELSVSRFSRLNQSLKSITKMRSFQ